jgi:hypothetical protein
VFLSEKEALRGYPSYLPPRTYMFKPYSPLKMYGLG